MIGNSLQNAQSELCFILSWVRLRHIFRCCVPPVAIALRIAMSYNSQIVNRIYAAHFLDELIKILRKSDELPLSV